MMMVEAVLQMEITYSKQVVKTIGRMDSATKQRIKTAIERLPDGDTKQIAGRSITTYRLRVGGWRVLYSFDDRDKIFIEKIAPRGEIYKGV
jgi:mRNA interferase RelE/StbE